MSRPTLFITGMQRSGTTLLEKLLSSHTQVSLLSQPFPFLFLQIKREFFHSIGLEPPRYPLGPLFREAAYAPDDLVKFLTGHVVTRAALEEAFSSMAGYSGQYTEVDPNRLQEVFETFQPGDLSSTLAQLYRLLALEPEARWCGGKETLCEEFLPFFLDRGVRAIVILRDPRDVLASLNHGEGQRFAGTPKPTLFNIRNWRKSVAFVLHFEHHPDFLWLRYEDLVCATDVTLERLTRFLGIAPFEEGQLLNGIRDQSGEIWRGNSSHGEYHGVSPASVGCFRRLLPGEVRTLVGALCGPELLRLGYPCDALPSNARQVIEEFQEPYPMPREELLDHLVGPSTVRDELARLELLEKDGASTVQQYFLFDDVYASLRGAYGR